MYDIVFPNGNENEFIKYAKKLGIEGLIFCYASSQSTEKKYSFQVVRCKINKSVAQGNQLNISLCERKFMEQKYNSFVMSAEDQPGRDHIHQRKSGLNHILCNLAKKNDIAIVFNYSLLFNKKKVHSFLGRMKQNAMLVRKYKCNYVIASCATKPTQLRNSKDVDALYRVLGLEKSKILKKYFK